MTVELKTKQSKRDYAMGRLEGYIDGWGEGTDKLIEVLKEEIQFELEQAEHQHIKAQLKRALKLICNAVVHRFDIAETETEAEAEAEAEGEGERDKK
jgi:hypothetical protein